eukprot:CAMPEP_0178994844 /NCGR_PEP_ID=MMETSP0795-20121207/7509_1 /TAXON_ID=88552 /ORGANISM="Amoebophrya sp., Strain Ameob2" /LENGTH=249 /DNA_ID=CAMNT_0020687109 /DNA_START=104 /DNA_END=850 /DNA_ORIENTATION=-
MDPFKYSFPAAIPGGGSSLPPATATMMWANGVKNSYEQALAAHQKLSANGNQIASTIAKMSAAVAQAEQAKLAAESSAAASFARDNGFAVAAATSGLGEGIGALAVGVVAGMAEVQGSCPSCREGSERTRTQEEIDENDKLGERKNTDFFEVVTDNLQRYVSCSVGVMIRDRTAGEKSARKMLEKTTVPRRVQLVAHTATSEIGKLCTFDYSMKANAVGARAGNRTSCGAAPPLIAPATKCVILRLIWT